MSNIYHSRHPDHPWDFVQFEIQWEDHTPYGSLISGRLQKTIITNLYPKTYAVLLQNRQNILQGKLPKKLDSLYKIISTERSTAAYKKITKEDRFLYPETRLVKPARIIATSTFNQATLHMPWSIDLQNKIKDSFKIGPATLPKDLKEFFLLVQSAVKQYDYRRPLAYNNKNKGLPLFVGHGCVTWSDGNCRLWIDPFFRPKNQKYSKCFQPLLPFDFPESKHFVLITHSHRDHFDPASLLYFPNDTIFIVPQILKESVLSINIAFRLNQLGFQNVEKIAWWKKKYIGSFTITALPFFGEQPVSFMDQNPLEITNHGNTYFVQHKSLGKTLLLADSGSDPRQHVLHFARKLRKKLSNITFLFSNHRKWDLYPPIYLLSSVPQYLLFVKQEELKVSQRIMFNPEELARFAEIIGAQYIIPYAMGGAKWFSDIKLGVDYLAPQKLQQSSESHPKDLECFYNQGAEFSLTPTWQPITLIPGQWINKKGKTTFVEGFSIPQKSPTKHHAQS